MIDSTIVSTSIYVAVAFKQISYVVCGELKSKRDVPSFAKFRFTFKSACPMLVHAG